MGDTRGEKRRNEGNKLKSRREMFEKKGVGIRIKTKTKKIRTITLE